MCARCPQAAPAPGTVSWYYGCSSRMSALGGPSASIQSLAALLSPPPQRPRSRRNSEESSGAANSAAADVPHSAAASAGAREEGGRTSTSGTGCTSDTGGTSGTARGAGQLRVGELGLVVVDVWSNLQTPISVTRVSLTLGTLVPAIDPGDGSTTDGTPAAVKLRSLERAGSAGGPALAPSASHTSSAVGVPLTRQLSSTATAPGSTTAGSSQHMRAHSGGSNTSSATAPPMSSSTAPPAQPSVLPPALHPARSAGDLSALAASAAASLPPTNSAMVGGPQGLPGLPRHVRSGTSDATTSAFTGGPGGRMDGPPHPSSLLGGPSLSMPRASAAQSMSNVPLGSRDSAGAFGGVPPPPRFPPSGLVRQTEGARSAHNLALALDSPAGERGERGGRGGAGEVLVEGGEVVVSSLLRVQSAAEVVAQAAGTTPGSGAAASVAGSGGTPGRTHTSSKQAAVSSSAITRLPPPEHGALRGLLSGAGAALDVLPGAVLQPGLNRLTFLVTPLTPGLYTLRHVSFCMGGAELRVGAVAPEVLARSACGVEAPPPLGPWAAAVPGVGGVDAGGCKYQSCRMLVQRLS